ncbi:MAG: hypothetical protein K6E73_11510 [Bacteroidales bacterium]|nr:hypothetical protein [Bacteroidales bacterium]
MKKIILSLILLTGCAIASAQVNLREGIVITLGGDTLHGMIDYRTDRINAEQCVFMADHASAATTYKPGEIAGYRFMDNGRYYVSRTVPMPDSTMQTVFLEFLVRGQLNGYYLANAFSYYYYLEDEQGNMAIVKKPEDMKTTESARDKHTRLDDALNIMKQSGKAQQMLWGNDITSNYITKTVVAYNDEVCPDGKCEIFKYRSKKRPKSERPIHLTLSSGYTSFRLTMDNNLSGQAKTFPAYNAAVGCDIYVPRLCKGLLAQIYIDYTHTASGHIKGTTHSTQAAYNMAGEAITIVYTHEFDMKYRADELSIKAGPAYQFPFWKVQPRIGGGILFTKAWEKTSGYDYLYNRLLFMGRYARIGVVCPLHKGALTFDCNYSKTLYSDWNTTKLSFNLGYQF